MAPDNEGSLRSQLTGSWELIEYCTYSPNDESDKSYPLGKEVRGIIMYSTDGYMSSQLQIPGQKTFGEQEGTGSESDWAELGRKYAAYTGQFYLDERGDAGPVLWHHMRHSNMPYLRGDTQKRLLKIVDESDGRYLTLSLDEPKKQMSGEPKMARVRWKRLPDNQAPTPP